ncbi:MAG TPA: MBL fold metallo-hydrolase [Cellvibrionaceae bacterium]
MRFASLGSGSQGNATLVSCDGEMLLIDCGFSLRELQARMLRLDAHPSGLLAVLVTHEHSDHIRGIGPLARKYGLPVVMTAGTRSSGRLGRLPVERIIEPSIPFELGGFTILPVPVAHDAAEPSQFVFYRQGKKLGLLTDLGSITAGVIDAYQSCDALLIEANHDPIMLACGPYPASLKRRVAGQWGHLSNAQTQSLLTQLDISRLQHLVIGHISQTNNSICRAAAALEGILPRFPIHYACQNQGFDWLTLQ